MGLRTERRRPAGPAPAEGPVLTARRPALDPGAPHPESPAPLILLIDNYDSFTFNLYHFLGDLVSPWGVEIEVRRNDALTSQEALAMRPDAIVLSPGPCTPNEAGICLPLIGAAAS